MAIVQISRIQVRSGNIADLPQLAVGEFGWAVDTKQLFIGNDPNTIGPQPDNTEILTQYSNGGGGGTPAGANTDVQYNNDGAFGGNSNFTWNNANTTLSANIVNASGAFFINSALITEGYTLPLNYNAMTAGPVTVMPGATVLVEAGSRWNVV
jgi:hypothetical protein